MEALLHQYTPLLRYVIGGVLRDPQDAEDCFSEVSLALWKGLAGYDPAKSRLTTYLTTVARNTALNHLKAKLRREQHLAEPMSEAVSPVSPEEEVLRRERQERLQAAVGALSDRDRKLFYRRYYYLQPVAQIAAEMGISQRAAEGRLYRLRQQLRQQLGGDDL
jgi:RNA polymerase sigma-70 factor (ECF subfamily)